ncbi:hypothetical protein C0J45_19176 [Silurus meridionalis]|nr:hypothetical protein C0J45_19176 [Silurus meridionalis]
MESKGTPVKVMRKQDKEDVHSPMVGKNIEVKLRFSFVTSRGENIIMKTLKVTAELEQPSKAVASCAAGDETERSRQEAEDLHCYAQTHVVRKDAADMPVPMQAVQEGHAIFLMLIQLIVKPFPIASIDPASYHSDAHQMQCSQIPEKVERPPSPAA